MDRLSVVEQAEIWDRWEAGESQRSICRALGRSPSTIRDVLVRSGWRRPVPEAAWSPLRLSLSEREEISRGLAAGGDQPGSCGGRVDEVHCSQVGACFLDGLEGGGS